MKKQYFIIEFIILFAILALPPLLVSNQNNLQINFNFNYTILFQLGAALLLDFQKRFLCRNVTAEKKTFIYYLKYAFTGFILLCLSFILIQITAGLFPTDADSSDNSVIKPENIFKWCICIFMLLSSAYYEEILYRQFIPESLLFLTGGVKIVVIAVEVFSVLIFSLSHRYLGFFPALNAFVSGFILRFVYRKTGSVYTGTIIHFLYNLSVFLFF